jgi:hypothetical protein
LLPVMPSKPRTIRVVEIAEQAAKAEAVVNEAG